MLLIITILLVIDTISFKCEMELNVHTHDDWRFHQITEAVNPNSEGDECLTAKSFKASHGLFGIYVSGREGMITHVKVSLPRMLHGDNAELLVDQEQVDAAMGNLFDVLSEIADTSSGLSHFTRVDIVWQFNEPPIPLIRAHKFCKFPRCRRPQVSHSESSSSWNYDGMRIIMYDKVLQMSKRAGDITRVEVQLSKGRLKKYLSDSVSPVQRLDFNCCYRAYRKIMTTFAPSVSVDTPRDIYESMAILEADAAAGQRTSPMSLLLSSMNTRTANDWRRKVTAASLRRVNFQWENVLPKNEPPAAVAAG